MTRLRAFGSVVAVVGVLASSSVAWAELDAFMSITGARQGEIRGGATQKGREGQIAVTAVDHTVQTPVDAASGMATGKRQHKPFVITKDVDRSSPLLHTALAQNEVLTDVVIRFYAAARTGAEAQYYTVTLKNARIASIQHVMDDNSDPAKAKRPAYERVAFTYESITWTFTDGGVTSTDTAGGAAR